MATYSRVSPLHFVAASATIPLSYYKDALEGYLKAQAGLEQAQVENEQLRKRIAVLERQLAEREM